MHSTDEIVHKKVNEPFAFLCNGSQGSIQGVMLGGRGWALGLSSGVSKLLWWCVVTMVVVTRNQGENKRENKSIEGRRLRCHRKRRRLAQQKSELEKI